MYYFQKTHITATKLAKPKAIKLRRDAGKAAIAIPQNGDYLVEGELRRVCDLVSDGWRVCPD